MHLTLPRRARLTREEMRGRRGWEGDGREGEERGRAGDPQNLHAVYAWMNHAGML